MNVRENWRVIALVVLLVGSGTVLFTPGLIAGATGPSNLQYGLELDGGTRIRAPVVGMTAEDVSYENFGQSSEISQARQGIADDLGVPLRDVYLRPGAGTAEVFNRSVGESEFVSALNQNGIQAAGGGQVTADDVREGVTEATRNQITRVLERKLEATGLTAGSVTTATTVDGTNYIVVEAPNQEPEELRELISDRGVVTVYARYPGPNGTMQEQAVITYEDLKNVGAPEQPDPATTSGSADTWQVPVVLNQQGAQQFARVMQETGFTGEGAGSRACGGDQRNQEGHCLVLVSEGNVTSTFSVAPSLANTIESGQFAEDPRFVMTTGAGPDAREKAREVSVDLQAGALRAPLDFQESQVFTLEPALAERFKLNSLLTGIVAVLAVSGVVYLRYGDPKVALPMILTALAEVVLLLGFVAAVRLPLDLSHIAGFIAVIGTGVDDLIIIADEVMDEGGVSSTRVFQSRFRKAFWVIGAAAATTIIAMSPLAVLSLGDLRGFAIVTILGVLIGVLITRPAYGDILRSLTTGEH
ncbi:preprotein translocase subunit SecD [Haloarchaeobius amylolyticus]|uniref:preprotein translocase subunit SecD n=1 Tax=Haloarchaeobius amylolyticus TaxID=1198296 RepID=UPI0022708932|nr:preprotein translocase subunit SecD [Haloarchaeobius amylolyticus]